MRSPRRAHADGDRTSSSVGLGSLRGRVNVLDVINIAAGVVGFLSIAVLIWFAAQGDPEREAEERARLFYDVHGRWPDDGVS
jgi:hypothetical protein